MFLRNLSMETTDSDVRFLLKSMKTLNTANQKGKGEEEKMKIVIRRFYHEWAFSICLSPGSFWIEVLYFNFTLMTDKFAKENNPK